MPRVLPAALLLALGLVAPAAAQDAAAVARADRAAVAAEREVTAALAQRSLTSEEREFAACPPLGVHHERWRDAGGVTRLYRTDQGSDDSRVTTAQYYDGAGRLRLVIVEAAAVNGTALRDRIVIDDAGRRVRESRRRISGPGYTFPARWPDDLLVRTPDRSFASNDPCGRPAPR